jgi:hypothetical protein
MLYTKYVLEIHDPGSPDDVAAYYESDAPFQAIHVGDLIRPTAHSAEPWMLQLDDWGRASPSTTKASRSDVTASRWAMIDNTNAPSASTFGGRLAVASVKVTPRILRGGAMGFGNPLCCLHPCSVETAERNRTLYWRQT